MFDLIAGLQEKPARTRRAIACGIALGITLVIGIVWGTTLKTRTAVVTETEETGPSVLNPFIQGFISLTSSIQDVWKGE